MYKDEEVLETAMEKKTADPITECINCFETTCTPAAAAECNKKSPFIEIAKCYLQICGTKVCLCLPKCLGFGDVAGGKFKELYKQDNLSVINVILNHFQ